MRFFADRVFAGVTALPWTYSEPWRIASSIRRPASFSRRVFSCCLLRTMSRWLGSRFTVTTVETYFSIRAASISWL